MFPLVQEMARTDARVRVPVAVTCRVLGFSKQAFYQWTRHPISARATQEQALIKAIRTIHDDDPTFGYRFITDELHASGWHVSERRVWRLCRLAGVTSATVRKRPGKSCRPGPAVHDDRVQRVFTATAPNRLWLTDITEHPTSEGKLYLCAVKDVFSGRIVGYSIDSRMKSGLAVDALQMAVTHRGQPTGVTVHSDRGSQFRSQKFVRTLRTHSLLGSMGRVASAGDNAAMESFFSLLQKNVLNRQTWATRHQLRLAIITWIEGTYHRRRKQRRLGKLTPLEFETIMTKTVTLAA